MRLYQLILKLATAGDCKDSAKFQKKKKKNGSMNMGYVL